MAPFVITKQVSPVAYQLGLPPTWTIHDIFHASLLTRYKETAEHVNVITSISHLPKYGSTGKKNTKSRPSWGIDSLVKGVNCNTCKMEGLFAQQTIHGKLRIKYLLRSSSRPTPIGSTRRTNLSPIKGGLRVEEDSSALLLPHVRLLPQRLC